MLLLFSRTPSTTKAATNQRKHAPETYGTPVPGPVTSRRPVWSPHFKSLQSHQRRHWDEKEKSTHDWSFYSPTPPESIRNMAILVRAYEALVSFDEALLHPYFGGWGWGTLTSHEKLGVPCVKVPFPSMDPMGRGSRSPLQNYMDD